MALPALQFNPGDRYFLGVERSLTGRAWRDRLMAMPGFALPYDLIPKKDAELPA